MPFTVSNIRVDSSGIGVSYVRADVTPTGNYATGGDGFDLTPLAAACGSDQPPSLVGMESQTGNPGYYVWKRAATPSVSNGKVQAYAAGGTELTAAAYPAAFLADVAELYAEFPKLL